MCFQLKTVYDFKLIICTYFFGVAALLEKPAFVEALINKICSEIHLIKLYIIYLVVLVEAVVMFLVVSLNDIVWYKIKYKKFYFKLRDP